MQVTSIICLRPPGLMRNLDVFQGALFPSIPTVLATMDASVSSLEAVEHGMKFLGRCSAAGCAPVGSALLLEAGLSMTTRVRRCFSELPSATES